MLKLLIVLKNGTSCDKCSKMKYLGVAITLFLDVVD